ncbi:MAG: glycosyltransferase family 4 protein [Chitinispirillaceae bacterium]|nr:glycosyltransferase family 4 protein [Chitinispirillaceae bacterium]
MNIAFFSKELPSDRPNGVSVQVHRLAEALTEHGHKVTCFSFSPGPEKAAYHSVRLLPGPAGRVFRKFTAARIFRRIDTASFDILHYHGDDYLCPGARRRVRTFYGSARDEALHAKTPGRFCYQTLFHALEWFSCLKRGTLVAISAATKRSLPLISHLIPCGVPLDRFSPDRTRRSAHPSLLFIGDFKSRKQGDLLLRRFREAVLPAHPQATLTVVGPEAISSHNVRCLGRISEPELVAEYRKAWIYCLPSSYEGFGVPAIEAMACGCAVVAVRNAGTTEIIDHDKNGTLCTSPNLGRSLNLAIEDTALRERLVAGGLQKATHFDIRDIARQYQSLYLKATASHSPAGC